MQPQTDRFPEALKEVVGKLAPAEKADLYARGEVPDRLAADAANELLAAIRDLWTESDAYPVYEGRVGASPRELKSLLLNAADAQGDRCVSPLALLEALDGLVEDRSSYLFLQVEPMDGYHDAKAFVDVVRQRYLELVNQEVRDATGLVEERSYLELFQRYVHQIKHLVRKEKVENPVTGEAEDPDQDFLAEVEKKLQIAGDATDFRQRFFNRIGAWGHENPGEKIDLRVLFPRHIEQLRESYFAAQRSTLRAILQAVLRLGEEGGEGLDDDLRRRATHTLAALQETYGYPEVCAREAVAFLLKERYAQ